MSVAIRHRALLVGGRVMLIVASASLLAAVLIGARLFSASRAPPSTAAEQSTAENESSAGSSSLAPSDDVLADAPRVGIVAGHAGYDPGAMCSDGWSEAELNMTLAQEVERLLQRRGYQVDLLEEYDAQLSGYRADALVSVHADSCEVPGATGFKVARVTDSAIPQAEDRLVSCLYEEYEAMTRLPRHPSSITDNMTNYHAFREIDHYTPGAIIEVGFMLNDRDLLTKRPKLVARGIAAGVVCFVEGGP